MENLAGIAEADARLGRPFPLPSAALPLARWVEVRVTGAGTEVEWNLDDSRPGTPARLALYAGPAPPPSQLPGATEDADAVLPGGRAVRLRRAPLAEAQPSLRPVVELTWQDAGLHLRLTAQGPWELADLVALAASVSL